jgi:uncharacterized membrane protein
MTKPTLILVFSTMLAVSLLPHVLILLVPWLADADRAIEIGPVVVHNRSSAIVISPHDLEPKDTHAHFEENDFLSPIIIRRQFQTDGVLAIGERSTFVIRKRRASAWSAFVSLLLAVIFSWLYAKRGDKGVGGRKRGRVGKGVGSQ